MHWIANEILYQKYQKNYFKENKTKNSCDTECRMSFVNALKNKDDEKKLRRKFLEHGRQNYKKH